MIIQHLHNPCKISVLFVPWKRFTITILKGLLDIYISIDGVSFCDTWYNGTGLTFHLGKLRLDLCSPLYQTGGSTKAGYHKRRHAQASQDHRETTCVGPWDACSSGCILFLRCFSWRLSFSSTARGSRHDSCQCFSKHDLAIKSPSFKQRTRAKPNHKGDW
jgi:hypothetical protein